MKISFKFVSYDMNCWHCKTELIWVGDFNFEDYGIEEDGIVSTLNCPKCNSYVEVYSKNEN